MGARLFQCRYCDKDLANKPDAVTCGDPVCQLALRNETRRIRYPRRSYKIMCCDCGLDVIVKNHNAKRCHNCSVKARTPRGNVPVRKICEHCGKDFLAKNVRAKFCSDGSCLREREVQRYAKVAAHRSVHSHDWKTYFRVIPDASPLRVRVGKTRGMQVRDLQYYTHATHDIFTLGVADGDLEFDMKLKFGALRSRTVMNKSGVRREVYDINGALLDYIIGKCETLDQAVLAIVRAKLHCTSRDNETPSLAV